MADTGGDAVDECSGFCGLLDLHLYFLFTVVRIELHRLSDNSICGLWNIIVCSCRVCALGGFDGDFISALKSANSCFIASFASGLETVSTHFCISVSVGGDAVFRVRNFSSCLCFRRDSFFFCCGDFLFFCLRSRNV